MENEKYKAIQTAKQLVYIKKEDLEYMKRKEVTAQDCYRRMKPVSYTHLDLAQESAEYFFIRESHFSPPFRECPPDREPARRT